MTTMNPTSRLYHFRAYRNGVLIDHGSLKAPDPTSAEAKAQGTIVANGLACPLSEITLEVFKAVTR